MGVKWLRVVIIWQKVDSQGWAQYDNAINEARARGMSVLVTISGPVPKWASGNGKSNTYKPSPSKFQKFVTDVGNRYRDQVNLWSIWNEPNHPAFLTPQFVRRNGRRYAYSPALYRQLFWAGYHGLHASGNARDKILMGETEPVGGTKTVAPLRFLRGVLARRAKLPADGWAHHAYTTASGPRYVPRNRDNVTIGVLSRLTRALDHYGRMHRIRRGMPLYLTEFGIQSKPDPFIGVSWQQQAEFRSIAEQIAYRNRRVVAFSQYLMRDDNPRTGSVYARYSGFESGLRTSGGKAKWAYNGFRLPLVADVRGRHVYLWGLVRPATGRTRVLVQLRGSGSKRWRNLKHVGTNSSGYWSSSTSLRRGAQYRVAWSGYTGPATRAY
jgi:hypothetical protein